MFIINLQTVLASNIDRHELGFVGWSADSEPYYGFAIRRSPGYSSANLEFGIWRVNNDFPILFNTTTWNKPYLNDMEKINNDIPILKKKYNLKIENNKTLNSINIKTDDEKLEGIVYENIAEAYYSQYEDYIALITSQPYEIIKILKIDNNKIIKINKNFVDITSENCHDFYIWPMQGLLILKKENEFFKVVRIHVSY